MLNRQVEMYGLFLISKHRVSEKQALNQNCNTWCVYITIMLYKNKIKNIFLFGRWRCAHPIFRIGRFSMAEAGRRRRKERGEIKKKPAPASSSFSPFPHPTSHRLYDSISKQIPFHSSLCFPSQTTEKSKWAAVDFRKKRPWGESEFF